MIFIFVYHLTDSEGENMEVERMSRISKVCAVVTAKEFVDIINDKIVDCLADIQKLENELHTMKECVEETQLQLNNAIFEDCM